MFKQYKSNTLNSSMEHPISSLVISLLLLLLPFSNSETTAAVAAAAGPTIPYGSIYRATKQQVLATIPPGSAEPAVTFLFSPSGKYTALLLRTVTAPGAGGFGNDFCYIQIQEAETEQGLWESECGPVSTSNACTLVFDDAGLEVFDGPNSVYNTQADGDHVNELELVDQGDMRIIDKEGELSWKASDEPMVGQRCGLPGSDGLAPDSPPFAGVIGGGNNGPFGQQGGQPAVGPGLAAAGSGDEVAGGGGVGEEPLVDNTAYDSGSLSAMEVSSWFVVSAVMFVCGVFM